MYCSLLPNDRAGFFKHATRPVVPVLRSKLQSSLYSIRAARDIRVLATIDDDPLFDRIIVTLLRVVRKKNIDKVLGAWLNPSTRKTLPHSTNRGDKIMAEIKTLLDEYGIIYEDNKILPNELLRLKLLGALAELEDNACHKSRQYPKTRLHRVRGYEKAIYRADIDKISGWRLHVQFDSKTKQLHLKDIIEGQNHDHVIKVIKSKKGRYE
jgi:hypothetical protein